MWKFKGVVVAYYQIKGALDYIFVLNSFSNRADLGKVFKNTSGWTWASNENPP